MIRWILVGAVLCGASAWAQDEAAPPGGARGGGGSRGAEMSVLSGKPLERGTVIHGQVGWPGISATLLTALDNKLDAGGRFSFMYGYEGMSGFGAVPGIKLQGILRLGLLQRGKINLGVHFEPGPFFYFFGRATEVGLALPVGMVLGINVSPKLVANVGFDVPMFVVFGPYGGLAVPLLLGGGVEYQVDPSLALTLKLRAGPSVPLTGHGYHPYAGGGYWCEDRGRLYRCGPYYHYNVPAAEVLVGVAYEL